MKSTFKSVLYILACVLSLSLLSPIASACRHYDDDCYYSRCHWGYWGGCNTCGYVRSYYYYNDDDCGYRSCGCYSYERSCRYMPGYWDDGYWHPARRYCTIW